MKQLWKIFLITSVLIISFSISYAESFDGVEYTVIVKPDLHTISYIEVRLEKKVSEDFLKNFAMKIHEEEKKDHIYIHFLLSGMASNTKPWARTVFNPDPVIDIFGPTIEEDKIIANVVYDYDGDVIGKWINNSSEKVGYALVKRGEEF
jgi:hypothetical protein